MLLLDELARLIVVLLTKNFKETIKKKNNVDTLSYKTISANKATAKKEWVVVDATDMVLGRMSSKVAKLLRGKYWSIQRSAVYVIACGLYGI